MAVIAVTGANGFVGRALTEALSKLGHDVRGLVRSGSSGDALVVGDIGAETEWSEALSGVDTVVHCAARVHVMSDDASDPLAAFREVNTAGTRRLACQAVEAGVKRLVFVSTIKVNGETTIYYPDSATRFTAFDSPDPDDAYAISKWEAEIALHEIAAESDLEVVIVRPPLVYGLGAGGNFRQLVELVRRQIPLPLGLVDNRRSLIALPNLVDLLVCCAAHPDAPGETFLASDGDDLSTPDLVRRLATAMQRKARLVPVPLALLRVAGRLTGQRDKIERLMGSLQVDIGHTCERLQWQPPTTVDEGLREAVRPA